MNSLEWTGTVLAEVVPLTGDDGNVSTCKTAMHILMNQQTQRCGKASCLEVSFFKSTNKLWNVCHKIYMNKPSVNEFYSYL
jgi:hypothetical protein